MNLLTIAHIALPVVVLIALFIRFGLTRSESFNRWFNNLPDPLLVDMTFAYTLGGIGVISLLIILFYSYFG